MKAYHWLLHLAFPAGFRRRFGRDMEDVFRDRLARARAAGSQAVATLWLRTLADLASHGLAERRSMIAGGHGPRSTTMLDTLRQDLRFGWRTSRRSASTVTIAALTLALGMGVSTAVFSVSDALVLRALPYPHADRLVALTDDNERGESVNVALPNFDDWRLSVTALDAAAAWTVTDVNAIGPSGAERLRGASLTGEFFDLTGTTPVMGRVFSDADESDVVVLGERAWRQLVGARPDLAGASVVINGVSHAVVGVVPPIPGFREVDVWRPLTRTGNATSRRGHAFTAMARLREGVSIERARVEFDVVSARLAAAYPESNRGWRAGVTPLQTARTEDLSPVLALVGWMAAAVLVVACTNVASLLVARVADRRREVVVRAALGASGIRIWRQLLVEHAIIAAAGGGLGLALAAWLTGLIAGLLPPDVVPVREPGVSARVVGFAVILSAGVSLLFGGLTAFAALRPQAAARLREAAIATSAGGRKLRQGLVFVQITTACTMLICAGLLISSFARALGTDSGLTGGSVMTFRVTPPGTSHPNAAALGAYYDGLLSRLAQLPEVEVAAATSNLPMSDNETVSTVRRPDEPVPARGKERFSLHLVSTPGYLRAVGARLVAGRDFADGDTAGAEPVVIVNEQLARELWGTVSVVGQRVVLEPDTAHLVVGVIADTRHFGLDRPLYAQYLVPFAQRPVRSMDIAVRLRSDLPAQRLREVVTSTESTVPPYAIRSLETLMGGSLAIRRGLTGAVAAAGLTIVLLAIVGLYGVVASGVRDRRREIGIRMALGATGTRVVRLFVGRAGWLSAAAVLAGLTASVWAVRLLDGLLFEIEPLDPVTFALSAATLSAVALATSWASARQAAAVNPVDTLRTD